MLTPLAARFSLWRSDVDGSARAFGTHLVQPTGDLRTCAGDGRLGCAGHVHRTISADRQSQSGHTETVFALGADDRLVAVDTYSNDPAEAERLTIGHREVDSLRRSPLTPAGTRVRGHEFHWSIAENPPHQLAAYLIMGAGRLEGICISRTLGSYEHLNLAGAPQLAAHFVASGAQIQDAGVC